MGKFFRNDVLLYMGHAPSKFGGKSKIFLLLSLVALLLMLMPTSCSKTGYTVTETSADSATQIIIAADEMNVSYEYDQAVNEALLATTISRIASGDSLGIGNSGGEYNTITNVVIDTSEVIDSALIRLTYAGKNADQTKGRSGIITLQYARDGSGKIIPWKNAGASITMTFEQYEVILLSNNSSLWMNGTATITNASGGLLRMPANMSLPAGDSLRDRANGSLTFTYNDNVAVIVTWTWALNQARSFYEQGGVLTSAITGDTVISGLSNVSTSGINRFNNTFYTGTVSPVVQSISSLYLLSNPLSGEKSIHGITEPMLIYYGVDNHGNPVTSGTPYGYKITWAFSGVPEQTIVPY